MVTDVHPLRVVHGYPDLFPGRRVLLLVAFLASYERRNFMTGLRLGLAAALMLGTATGCSVGGPERASSIQNVDAASDDIAAITMTQSILYRADDPNKINTTPYNNQLVTNSEEVRK
jgi:hypothetical protein